MARKMVIDGQISFLELLASDKAKSHNPIKILAVGDLIGKRVLGEVRVARITKIEGLPNYPFYRTDRGCCYSVEDGYNRIDDLERQAEIERKKYKTIIPKNLTNRITWRYTRTADRRELYAQIGIMDGMLFWKDFITYQFLEPYENDKKLKKAYEKKKKEIEENMKDTELIADEYQMRRLYWSKHGFYADAEYVKFNG